VKQPLLAGALLLAVLVLACGGGGGGSALPTSTPILVPPPLDPRLEALARGTVYLRVAPGSRQVIDPLALAREAGEAPPCASFVFLFSWRVQEGHEVKFIGRQQGNTVDIDRRQTGRASVGCMLLEAVNEGNDALDGELHYVIARSR
jgi:hypothetical protein